MSRKMWWTEVGQRIQRYERTMQFINAFTFYCHYFYNFTHSIKKKNRSPFFSFVFWAFRLVSTVSVWQRGRGCKVECVISMVAVSILAHSEFGANDHRKDAPLFIIFWSNSEMRNDMPMRHVTTSKFWIG